MRLMITTALFLSTAWWNNDKIERSVDLGRKFREKEIEFVGRDIIYYTPSRKEFDIYLKHWKSYYKTLPPYKRNVTDCNYYAAEFKCFIKRTFAKNNKNADANWGVWNVVDISSNHAYNLVMLEGGITAYVDPQLCKEIKVENEKGLDVR